MILSGLAMPHSPRVYDGKLYVLLSATGEVIAVDLERRQYDVVNRVKGFARGMARCGDYLFVGDFEDPQAAHLRRPRPGVGHGGRSAASPLLHLPTGAFVADLRYLRSCEEIYDVQVLPGMRAPGLLGLHDDTYRHALSLPDQVFWGRERDEEADGD